MKNIPWQIEYLDEAQDDMRKFDKGMLIAVSAGIEIVSANPLPRSEGGRGYPLGNRRIGNLTGF